MKQFLISLLIGLIISFSGCYQDQDSLADVEVGRMDSYYFENDIEVLIIEDAFIYVHDNITYKADTSDYWQIPEETDQLKTGDCEDMAILFMYLCKTKLNINSDLVYIEKGSDSHVLPKINGTFYEIKNFFTCTVLIDGWVEQWSCTYDETIWMTYNYHNNVGQYY